MTHIDRPVIQMIKDLTCFFSNLPGVVYSRCRWHRNDKCSLWLCRFVWLLLVFKCLFAHVLPLLMVKV